MASEGTHIRLAVDMLEENDIQNIGEYISGTIYPDSRYITKIERELTHGSAYLKKEFMQSDFQKGWRLHLLCDDVQIELIKDMLDAGNQAIEGVNDLWIDATAVKVAQEMSDLASFDISKYLQYIKLELRPNDEDIEKLKEYYDLLRNFYAKSNLGNKDYTQFFSSSSFGIPKNISEKVLTRCAEFRKNESKRDKIDGLYDRIVKKTRLLM